MLRFIRGAGGTSVRRAGALAALLALVVGLFAACGGDDGDQQSVAQQQAQQQDEAQQAQPSQAAPSRPAEDAPEATEPLKIGYLADFSGPIAEFGPVIETGVRLAIKHLNEAGGVNGRPVELVIGDTGLDPTRAVEEARRLIEVEGVHAIVGPLASSVTLAVAESVSAPARIPTISPSATSPQLSVADDDGYLFRSTSSDAAQGPALAQLAAAEGYSNVAVLYINDPYGQGLSEAFAGSWGGELTSVAIEGGSTSYLSELQAAAANGADVLIAMSFPQEAQVYLREALENEIFDTFLFVDGTKSQDMIDAIGAEYLNDMKGTAPASGPETDSLRLFNEAYIAEYGELSPLPFIREAYDATIAIGLAAAAAGSNDGTAIRDALPFIASPGGVEAVAGAEGVAAALAVVSSGGDINYEGAATTLDWNVVGDITTGFIGVWQFQDGAITELSVEAFDLGGGAVVAAPAARDPSTGPVVIAFMTDFTGPLAEFGPELQRGVELAIEHVNAAGGILGRPVVLVTGDTQADPTVAVAEARRLVNIEGAVAIAGPFTSVATLAVAEAVSGPLGVPTVTPGATSPQISLAADDGYLFRATISDAAQGPVLAMLAEDEGYERVGVLYRNDPYGQGLAEAFAAAFGGEANLVAIEDSQTSFVAELQRAAANDAEVLVVIGFPREAAVFVREALEQGIFDEFLFVDGSKSQDLIAAIGAEFLNGMRGTAQAPGPETPALAAWNQAYIDVHGELPKLPFVRETYDAAMSLLLAIEAAGTTNNEAIRDALYEISSPGGDIVIPGVEGIAQGLEILRGGGDINYEGAATTLDWDENGDVTSGYIGIWEYRDGAIVEVEAIPFSLE